MKRLLTLILVLAALGFGGYKVYHAVNEAKSTETEIRTDIAKVRDLETVVNATGEVLPLLSSIVKSEISGRIVSIAIDEGDSVVRDQPLMELDRTSLETRVREAERSLEAERLKLDKAERNFIRLKELFERAFVGEQEFLDAETEFNLAQLNLEIAQTRLEDAEEDLSKTVILAPHDGIITLLNVVEGEVISGATSVSNGTDLLTIAQLRDLYMEANINEVDVERLSKGHKARLTFDAIQDYSLEGTIGSIALSARRDDNIRVFPIEVVFVTDDARVRPGISATVELPIAEARNAVSVLLSAVFINEDDGMSSVFVRSGDSWVRRRVEVGINDLQYVEIKSGLSADDVVALSRPGTYLKEDE